MDAVRVRRAGWAFLALLVIAKARAGAPPREREFEPGPGGPAALNSAQGLHVTVEQGVAFRAPLGTLELRLSAWGRGETPTPVAEAVPSSSGTRAELRRGTIVEWVENGENAVEHGATIAAPPPGERGDVFLSWKISGSLSPRPSKDSLAIAFVTPQGKHALRYAGLSVRDAGGTPLQAFFDVRLGEMRIDYDDRSAVYPVTIDPIATTADFSQESNQASAYYGFAVATAGDVNGDGYSDLLVGAYNYSGGQANEGRVYVYHGSASGPSTTAARILERDQAGAHFGYSVASAGDFNGDGYDDIVVGAPDWDGKGAIFVYFGSATGIGTTPSFTFVSPQAGSSFGVSVSGAGDVNNDGYDDIIVGAPGWDGSVAGEGAAFVFHGGSSNPVTWAWMVEPTNQSGSNFGASVSRAGDVNGDGYADVVVGAPGHNLGQSAEGSITVYHGSSTGLSTTFARQVGSNVTNAQLGFSVAAAGDVNGDGYADVIAGAPHLSNGQGDEGRAYIFHGSSTGIGASANRTLEENQVGAEFGWSVATAGDVNADGYADVVVGAHLWANGASGEGAAFVYLGSPTGVPAAHAWVKLGSQSGAELGRAVSTAGDTDGDGFSEIFVGSPLEDDGQTDEGLARTFDGTGDVPSLTPSRVLLPSGANTSFGLRLVAIGDVNADGYSDAAVLQIPNGGPDAPVLIYYGSSAGLPATAGTGLFAPSGADPTRFGTVLARAGDVNGDGYDDLLAGVSLGAANEPEQALVYLGSSSGMSTSPGWTCPEIKNCSYHILPLGDVNGDGYADWAVGPGGTGFRIYFGGPTLPAPDPPSQSIIPDGMTESPGTMLGDVNGDGFDDFAILNYPWLEVYYGSKDGLPSTPVKLSSLPLDNEINGAPAGDVNGDGYADVIIGRPEFVSGGSTTGRAEIWFGSATGLGSAPGWTYTPSTNGAYGYRVASAGDVDGDGYGDVIVTNFTQYVDLFLGGPGGPGSVPAVRFTADPLDNLGYAIAGGADFNGDGFGDILLAAPNGNYVNECFGDGVDAQDYRARLVRADRAGPIAFLGKSDSSTSFRINALVRPAAGRNDVRMDHEAVPLGTSFGSAIVKGNYFDSGAPGTNGSDIGFDRLVSGLSGGPDFVFRFRFSSRNPLFPRTRWLTLPQNGKRESDLCLPSTWYRDADGDGYGNSSVSLVQCSAPSGWVLTGGDCDDTTFAVFPGHPEICDGLDNDCDGAIDSPIAPPTGIQVLTVVHHASPSYVIDIHWTGTGAVSERGDVSRGLLSTLHANGGNFATSTQPCLGNDQLNSFTDVSIPPLGDGFWYVSRAVNCAGVSTYDDGSPSQKPGRNAGILASPGTCP